MMESFLVSVDTGVPTNGSVFFSFPPGSVVFGDVRQLPNGQWEIPVTITTAEPDPEPVIVEGS